MNVVMLPLSAENPYQALLAEGLQHQDCAVTIPTHTVFLPELLGLPKPRAVHLHWLEPFYTPSAGRPAMVNLAIFFIQLSALKLTRTPIIWTLHNLRHHESRNSLLEGIAYAVVYRAAHSVVVHCQNAREQLQAKIHAAEQKPGKIIVIPHGNYRDAYANALSRETARSRLGLSRDNLVFLSLGAVRDYKGGTELVESFSKMDVGHSARLLIVGKPQTERVRREIEGKAARLGDRLLFVPDYVGSDDIQTYMNAADIFVAPFRNVLTSGSVILALSFGKPVIAPRLGCLPELLNDTSQFLYDPCDPDGLRLSLEAAVGSSSGALEALGHQARRVADRLDWGMISVLTSQCYEQAWHEARPPR